MIFLVAIAAATPTFGLQVHHFDRVSQFKVDGAVAEIVTATPDGRTLIYTNSADKKLGFVDVSTPAAPRQIASLDVPGEPTSAAVTPDGAWVLGVIHGDDDVLVVVSASSRSIARSIELPGQPDSITVSPNGRYAAIAIENERDESVNGGRMPQFPAGSLVIVDIVGQPSEWTTRTVAMTGLADRFADDPEPEFLDINANNIAALTMQENNHIVLIDLASGTVTADFSAGTTTHAADLKRDNDFILADTLTAARREPDAIAWTPGGRLVVANEGDYNVDLATGEFIGGRNFTVLNTAGDVVFDATDVEVQAIRHGHYNDSRSNSKGVEIEGVEVGTYGGRTFLFVGSERAKFVAVYSLADETKPTFLQLLPAGDGPEGLLAIPGRSLFVTANENDGTLSIFEGRPEAAKPDYPDVISSNKSWSALSGLSGGPGRTVYAVTDSIMRPSRIFTIELTEPAQIVESLLLAKNYDLEGVAAISTGFWLASEGAGNFGDATVTNNLLVRVNRDGAIAEEIKLPSALNEKQKQYGFEGVTTSTDEKTVYVAFQREWADDPANRVKIGVYDTVKKSWTFFRYPLDAAPAGGWVGLSEITRVNDTTFDVIERDNQAGDKAKVKRVYRFSTEGITPVAFGGTLPTVTKRLIYDMLAETGTKIEKAEGLTWTPFGMIVAYDNDGFGETRLIRRSRVRNMWK